MYFSKHDIENLDRIKRLNIINSIAGIRPANLIGTCSANNITNLAIFSSVMHLGSNPALMGFILRPYAEVKRHTYDNIKATGVFSINHVPINQVTQAHATSAKFSETESEFDHCGFSEQWLDEFAAPFVQQSLVKIGLSFVQEIYIELNRTTLVIGQVEHLYIDGEISDAGYIDLQQLNSAAVAGLNNYYQLQKIACLDYARVP